MSAQDFQFKLQAYLDGELPDREAAEVRELIARDRDAQLLLAELENTNAALAGHEAGVKLPETREFYWSRIAREIEREQQPDARPEKVSRLAWASRHFGWLSAAAAGACAVVLLAVWAGNSPAQLAEMELSSDDMGAYTFRDQQEKMTMIWFYDRQDDSQFTPPVVAVNVASK
jgi:anti-sigma factor RsiW